MMQPAFSPAWLRDAIADLPTENVRVLGHGLWGPTVDLGDGTLLKFVRRQAGIGDGLDIQGNEARVLAALLMLQFLTGLSNIVLDWPLLLAVLHNGGAAALVAVLVGINLRCAQAARRPLGASSQGRLAG